MTCASFLYLKKERLLISRTHNEKQRQQKAKKILDAARQVFYRKGFLAATMQDIIDECGISRGGIYLYFASIDEVFLEVMKQRNKETITGRESFADVLSAYFRRQKRRLLCFENSLFRAYCEYIFSKPKPDVEAFRDMQLGHLRKSVTSILMLGVEQNVIRDENISQLADHFIIAIDGLSVLALAEALTEEIIDAQFDILMKLVDNLRE